MSVERASRPSLSTLKRRHFVDLVKNEKTLELARFIKEEIRDKAQSTRVSSSNEALLTDLDWLLNSSRLASEKVQIRKMAYTNTDLNKGYSYEDEDVIVYVLLSRFLRDTSTGGADDPVCEFLYEFYQTPEQELKNFVLQFVPALIEIFLNHCQTDILSPNLRRYPAGIEALLLLIYDSEVELRANKERTWNPPTLRVPSYFHSPTVFTGTRRKTVSGPLSPLTIGSSNFNSPANRASGNGSALFVMTAANGGGGGVFSLGTAALLTDKALRELDMPHNVLLEGPLPGPLSAVRVRGQSLRVEQRELIVRIALQQYASAFAHLSIASLDVFSIVCSRLCLHGLPQNVRKQIQMNTIQDWSRIDSFVKENQLSKRNPDNDTREISNQANDPSIINGNHEYHGKNHTNDDSDNSSNPIFHNSTISSGDNDNSNNSSNDIKDTKTNDNTSKEIQQAKDQECERRQENILPNIIEESLTITMLSSSMLRSFLDVIDYSVFHQETFPMAVKTLRMIYLFAMYNSMFEILLPVNSIFRLLSNDVADMFSPKERPSRHPFSKNPQQFTFSESLATTTNATYPKERRNT